MATTETFKKKRLFKVARQLNVSTDRVVEFLEDQGYEDALSGSGFNASITDEEAYFVLLNEYSDDAEAASRVREMRAAKTEGDGVDRGKVTAIKHEGDGEAAEAEVANAEPEAASAEEPETASEEAPPEEAATEAATTETAEAATEEAPEDEAKAQPAADEAPAEPEASTADEAATADEDSSGPERAGEADSAEVQPSEEAAAKAPEQATEATADTEEAAAEEATPEESTVDASAPEESAPEEPKAEKTPEEEQVTETPADEEATAEPAETTADAEPEEAATEDEAASIAPEETALAKKDDDVVLADVDDEEIDTVEAKDEEAEEDEDTLKANRYRLSGTEVVGKVDLSRFRKRRRKRKRKKSKKQKKKKQKKKKQKKKRSKKKSKKKKRRQVDEEDVEQTIQETLQELEQGASRARQRRRRRRRERHAEQRRRERQRRAEEDEVLRVTEFVSTGELANLMGEPVNEVISTLFGAGMMVSINQRLDRDTIEFVADEYGLEVEFVEEYASDLFELKDEDDPEDLEARAPVVTVMGHVDHGKTSLLDYIRSANVVAGEEGGITQHIGAYKVEMTDLEGEITFLDTPGHEAFTAMRARGAKATDVVILVVAADDGVMPQTIEAINHAQAAEVPLVVAINKIDKRESDPQRVMQELSEQNVLVEPYGGKVQCAEVSAETGEGINDLLEKVVLQAELLELKGNPDRAAAGLIIESRKEKGRGNVVTVLVQNGSLEVGDPFVAGIHSGRIRAMFDERDNRVERVGPSQPVLVLGSNGQPEVGDQFVAMEDEGYAREIASERQQIHREQELRRKSQVSLDQISQRMGTGEFQELNLIVKADVGGSVEALADSLLKLKTSEVAVNIIHSGVGAITESDVMLARASEAVIIGFQVRPTPGARSVAEREEVDIRTYSIIYDAIEDVHDALEGLLSPERNENTLGTAEVREIFKVPNVGTVAGSYVIDGTISRNAHVRVIRDGVVIYEGEVGSLKHYQDDVKQVQSGYECGISVEQFNDIKVGDQLESYEVVESRRTLEV